MCPTPVLVHQEGKIHVYSTCKRLLRGKTVATGDSAEVSGRDIGEIGIVLAKAQGLLGPVEEARRAFSERPWKEPSHANILILNFYLTEL